MSALPVERLFERSLGLSGEQVDLFLRSLRLLGTIEDQELIPMLPHFSVLHFERGRRIGEGARYYGYFLLTGSARRFDRVSDATLEICVRGEFFTQYHDPPGLLDGIEFLSDSTVVSITRRGHDEILRRFPALARIDNRLMAHKLMVRDRIRAIRSMPVAQQWESIEREFGYLLAQVPQYSVADLFGWSAEHFSRMRRRGTAAR